MNDRPPAGLRLYRFAMNALAPFAGIVLSRRLRHKKEHPIRFGERRGETAIARPAGPLVWFHGASVGELLAAFPLVGRLHQRGFRILVTSGTMTSAALAKERLPADVIHQFVPLDIPKFVARFLDHWKPDLALFIESDLWPNLVLQSGMRRIPMIVINGRLSEKSFRRWKTFPNAAKSLFEPFDLCLAQSALDAHRFSGLGAARVEISGNLKLDVPPPPVNEDHLTALRAAIGGRPVIAAASTHAGEEAPMLDAHRRLRQRFPGLLTIIAPRHPQRGGEIADLATRFMLQPVLRSQRRLPDPTTEIYVADTMGELGLTYSVAPIVFMGGSLVEHGGQNPIEAIKFGAAVMHGPHVGNFAEIYAALNAARGATKLLDAESLVAQTGVWLRDEASRSAIAQAGLKTVNRLGGALQRTLAELEPYLMQLQLNQRPANA